MIVNLKLSLDKNYSRWRASCEIPNELTGLLSEDPSYVKEVTFVGGALDHVMTLAKEYFNEIEKKYPGEKIDLSYGFEKEPNNRDYDINRRGHPAAIEERKPKLEEPAVASSVEVVTDEKEKLVDDPYRREVFLDTPCTCQECGTMITSPRIVVRPFLKGQNFYIGLAAYCPLCGREIKHNGIEAYNRKARKFGMNETSQFLD